MALYAMLCYYEMTKFLIPYLRTISPGWLAALQHTHPNPVYQPIYLSAYKHTLEFYIKSKLYPPSHHSSRLPAYQPDLQPVKTCLDDFCQFTAMLTTYHPVWQITYLHTYKVSKQILRNRYNQTPHPNTRQSIKPSYYPCKIATLL